MDNGVLFQELESPYMLKGIGKVKDWKYVSLHKYDNDRLYYKPLEDNGFTFCYLQFHSCSEDMWNCPKLEVIVAAHGYGFFDGLRHVWFNQQYDHNQPDGYWYYPNTSVAIELFTQLRELEKTYCTQSDSFND